MSWTPAELTGKQLWLDASDASTITLDAGKVTEWRDKSGNTYHVSEATGSNQPTLISAGQNGLDIIRFNGTSSRLRRTTSTNLGRNVQELSCYVVRKFTSSPASYQVCITHSNNGPFPRVELSAGFPANKEAARILKNTDLPPSNISSTASVGAGFELTEIHGDFINGFFTLYKTGAVDNQIAIATGTTENTASNTIDIGVVGGGSGFWFDGDLAEIIYVHSLAAGDREKIEGYLAHKWLIESLLPAEHLYKAAPPGELPPSAQPINIIVCT